MKLIVIRKTDRPNFTSYDVDSEFIRRLKHYLRKNHYRFSIVYEFEDCKLTLFSEDSYLDTVIWIDWETSPSLFNY